MQDDGVPMGGPLSCIIADLFLENSTDEKSRSAGTPTFRNTGRAG